MIDDIKSLRQKICPVCKQRGLWSVVKVPSTVIPETEYIFFECKTCRYAEREDSSDLLRNIVCVSDVLGLYDDESCS